MRFTNEPDLPDVCAEHQFHDNWCVNPKFTSFTAEGNFVVVPTAVRRCVNCYDAYQFRHVSLTGWGEWKFDAEYDPTEVS